MPGSSSTMAMCLLMAPHLTPKIPAGRCSRVAALLSPQLIGASPQAAHSAAVIAVLNTYHAPQCQAVSKTAGLRPCDGRRCTRQREGERDDGNGNHGFEAALAHGDGAPVVRVGELRRGVACRDRR